MYTERYNGHNFIELFDLGYQFSEKELADLVLDNRIVAEIEGDEHRWTRSMRTIFIDEGRYFSIWWQRGLTEYQDSEFYQRPEEVLREERQVTMTVVEWIPVKKVPA